MMKLRLLAVWCIATLGWLSAANAAVNERLEIGAEIKNFTLKVVNPDDVGAPYVGIDRYTGPRAKSPKKAVLLSFFATYCEPCKREMPYLGKLYDMYKEKGLMILSISIDKEPEKIETLLQLAKDSNASFPILTDRFNIVAKRYFIEKLPCLYLVNGEGKVAMVNVGYNDDISKKLLDSIRTAIGEPTSDEIPEELAQFMHGNNPSESTIDVKLDDGKAAQVALEGDTKAKQKKKRKGKRKKGKRKRD